jgi:hypothetical protein
MLMMMIIIIIIIQLTIIMTLLPLLVKSYLKAAKSEYLYNKNVRQVSLIKF